eukprot:1940013-Rhodomonas_salina.1
MPEATISGRFAPEVWCAVFEIGQEERSRVLTRRVQREQAAPALAARPRSAPRGPRHTQPGRLRRGMLRNDARCDRRDGLTSVVPFDAHT